MFRSIRSEASCLDLVTCVPPPEASSPCPIDRCFNSGTNACYCGIQPRKLGDFSLLTCRARQTNMRPATTFVKSVNTIYCAFLLGHSQDVDKFVLSSCQLSCQRSRLVRQILRKNEVLD